MIPRNELGAAQPAPFSFCPPEDELRSELERVCKLADDAETKKIAIADYLKELLEDANAAIAERFTNDPTTIWETLKAYTQLAEITVSSVIRTVSEQIHSAHIPTTSERMSVIFVGGSGRAEMAPFSDIDLLFLTPYKSSPWTESVIESVLHILWRLKLKVGYAVRTVDECLRLAREDVTIRTNLLEMRYLMGDKTLSEELENRLWEELFKSTGPEFVEAKLDERSERHKRQGGSRYLVEPNIKEGKGGLRDLQTLFWITKYLNHSNKVSEWVEMGVLNADEYELFYQAETFLWTVRCLMHLITGRATEKLTFDLQVEVSEALGFRDGDGRRGVEHFMQQYFRHAKHAGEITRIILVGLEEKHVKERPSLANTIRSVFKFNWDRTAEGFENRNGRLAISDPDAFLSEPANFLRLFKEAMETGLLLHPDAMRLVASNLHLIDDDIRNDPEVTETFISLLTDKENPERGLRRMNELGVLGAFIPEFEFIDAMMQFNMYHHYTVDEHTIHCISILNQIEQQELTEDLPLVSGILDKGVNRRVLYLALLLHDIGKGRPEAHEIIGAKIAKKVCKQLNLNQSDTETVVWLVRNHLLMSDEDRDAVDRMLIHCVVVIHVELHHRVNEFEIGNECSKHP